MRYWNNISKSKFELTKNQNILRPPWCFDLPLLNCTSSPNLQIKRFFGYSWHYKQELFWFYLWCFNSCFRNHWETYRWFYYKTFWAVKFVWKRTHKLRSGQSQVVYRVVVLRISRSKVFCNNGVLKHFAKFTRKYLYWSVYLNKIASLRSATLLKNRLGHRSFPVNFVKFLNTSTGTCFWNYVNETWITRAMCEICSKLTIKTLEQRHWRCLEPLFSGHTAKLQNYLQNTF